MRDSRFDELVTQFAHYDKKLYIVGGTSRDLLLARPFTDRDFVTDATPEEMKEIVPDASFAFARFGSVKLGKGTEEVDITTLREEGQYLDYRHPSYIRFIKDLKTDSLRRDFTINALYINKDYEVLDFHHGLNDLKKGIIRFIGDPDRRIQEDPLRILRAERFAKTLHFTLEEETRKAIERNLPLLEKLNPAKIAEEKAKEKTL